MYQLRVLFRLFKSAIMTGLLHSGQSTWLGNPHTLRPKLFNIWFFLENHQTWKSVAVAIFNALLYAAAATSYLTMFADPSEPLTEHPVPRLLVPILLLQTVAPSQRVT